VCSVEVQLHPFITLRLLELSGQLQTPPSVSFPNGKGPFLPVVYFCVIPQGLSGCFGEEKNPLSLLGFELGAIIISVNSKGSLCFDTRLLGVGDLTFLVSQIVYGHVVELQYAH